MGRHRPAALCALHLQPCEGAAGTEQPRQTAQSQHSSPRTPKPGLKPCPLGSPVTPSTFLVHLQCAQTPRQQPPAHIRKQTPGGFKIKTSPVPSSPSSQSFRLFSAASKPAVQVLHRCRWVLRPCRCCSSAQPHRGAPSGASAPLPVPWRTRRDTSRPPGSSSTVCSAAHERSASPWLVTALSVPTEAPARSHTAPAHAPAAARIIWVSFPGRAGGL